MKIGQQVTTKKIGCPTTGYVAGLLEASVMPEISTWREYYPEYSFVACVKFTKPQRALSMEEFFRQAPPEVVEVMSESDKELMYLNNVPYVKHAFYPVNDLELL